MINLHIEAISPEELQETLKKLLGGTAIVTVNQRQVADLAEAVNAADVEDYLKTADTTKATKSRKANKPAADPKKGEGDDLEPPAFLDRRPKAEPAREEPEVVIIENEATLEQLREAMSAVLKKDAGLTVKLTGILTQYKDAAGKPCAKASQVLPADRAAVIAACKTLAE